MTDRQRRGQLKRRRANVRAGIAGGGALALVLVPAAAQAQEPAAGKHYEVTNKSPQNVPGSLAYEITQANENPSTVAAPNIITFASSVTGTIDLKQGLPPVQNSLDLQGPGARRLTLNASAFPDFFRIGPESIRGADSGREKGDIGPPELDETSVLEAGVASSSSPSSLALTVSGLSIDNAPGSAESGGAIDTANLALTLTDDSFVNDSSGDDGGAVVSQDGLLTVSGSTFAYDTAVYGGALYAGDGTVSKIDDSTFVGNSSGYYGGAIVASDATIIASTVGGNESGLYLASNPEAREGVFGGGIADTGSLKLEDSIVAGNTQYGVANDIALKSDSYTLSATFSLIEDGTGLTGLNSSDITGKNPDLDPLSNNGGPTDTELPQAESPVINAGKAFGLSTDQRGLSRTVEFPNVPNATGSGGTDIGAVELQPYITSIGPRGNQPGETVTIYGSGFEGATAIYFGKVKAKSFKVVNDTEIAVVLPHNGKGRFAVRVVTPAGESLRSRGGGEYTYL
jgi:predicted outer membrane repeat protein